MCFWRVCHCYLCNLRLSRDKTPPLEVKYGLSEELCMISLVANQKLMCGKSVKLRTVCTVDLILSLVAF